MNLLNIKPEDFNSNIVHLWDKQWLLLTAGNRDNYNCMTVAWGSIGNMWNKPFAMVVVRDHRYTYEFIEKYDTFTLTAFSEDYRKALGVLGAKSGRDGDKIFEVGLTPLKSEKVDAPGFKEAELIIECKKIYFDDFKPENFLDKDIEKSYPDKDYHRIYFGEIVAIRGTERFKV